MQPTKVFHIYTKDECIYNNLSEEEFNEKWTELNAMVGLLHTDYSPTDLSYEECSRYWGGAGVDITNEPPGCDSY
tara:strand:+ start:149 stop:373 length:225 start_codon:yes stop_codon:yes gene_type:complete